MTSLISGCYVRIKCIKKFSLYNNNNNIVFKMVVCTQLKIFQHSLNHHLYCYYHCMYCCVVQSWNHSQSTECQWQQRLVQGKVLCLTS